MMTAANAFKTFSHAVLILIFPLGVFAEPIKIGVILPLSGALTELGNQMRNAILLADALEDKENRVEFLFEDDGFVPKNTISAIHKLTTQNSIRGVIVVGSGTAIAVADFAEKRALPMIAVAMSDKIAPGRAQVYRMFLPAKSQVDVLSNEIIRRDLKRIAVVTMSHESQTNIRNLFVEKLKDRVTFDEEVSPAETDLRTIALRIKQKNPDGIALFLLPPQLSNMARQLQLINVGGTRFSTMVAGGASEIRAAQGALAGTWFSTPDTSADTGAEEEFKRRYGKPEITEWVSGYDAAHVFIESAQSDIRSYFSGLKSFSGLCGNYPLSSEHHFEVPGSLKIVNADDSVANYNAASATGR